MSKILVIGSSGLVGSEFIRRASKKVDIIGVDEKTLDITDKSAVEDYFRKHNFDSVINFAAITDVDGAEKERENEKGFIWKLNVEGVKNLTEACKKYDKFLIQISTDFVFEGTEGFPGPYDELTPIPYNLTPSIGWYGWTKNRSENIVSSTLEKAAIVRIAYPFYSNKFEGKLDFAKNYLKLFDEERLFPIFTDQTFTPLLIDELIDPLLKIAKKKIEGVYHVVSNNTATPFDFVQYLLKKARGVEGVVQKGSMKKFLEAEGRTPRPRLGGLKTNITQKKLGMKFMTWQEMVDKFVNQLSIQV